MPARKGGKKARKGHQRYIPHYGNLHELNTSRLILDTVDEDVIQEFLSDYLDILNSSSTIYEKNGDYASRIFSSGWCQFLDVASRRLCHTKDHRKAMACEKWICHESCRKTSLASMKKGRPIDLPCAGGIRIYAIPIRSDGQIVGAINFGYGTPPTDIKRLKEIARLFHTDIEKLKWLSDAYTPQSAKKVMMAKKRLKTSAKLLGMIFTNKQTEKILTHRLAFENIVADIAKQLANVDIKTFDDFIQNALDKLSRFLNIDCSHILFLSENNETLKNVYDWCAKDLHPCKKQFQNIPITKLQEIINKFKGETKHYVSNVSQLSNSKKAELSIFSEKSLKSILCIPITAGAQPNGLLSLASYRATHHWHQEDVLLLQSISEAISQAYVRKQLQEQQQRDEIQLKVTLIKTISTLAQTLEKRDPYTAGHQRRVSLMAAAIAREMNLSELEIEGIRLGALIHDIGKISIPNEILTQPGKLSESEWNLIQTHPQNGYDIVKNIEFPWPIQQIILNHHERVDGSGYPNGLNSTSLPISCKIVAVADIIEAMMSFRPYRPAWSKEIALNEIKHRKGTFYDPAVVDTCLRLFKEKEFDFPEQEEGNSDFNKKNVYE